MRIEIVREVITSWRALILRQTAPLTVSLLEQRGRFEVGTSEESPFAAEMALAFVENYLDDEDEIVAAAARFETSMLRRAVGEEVDIAWDDFGIAFAANNPPWTPRTTPSSTVTAP